MTTPNGKSLDDWPSPHRAPVTQRPNAPIAAAIDRLQERVREVNPRPVHGRLIETRGGLLKATLPRRAKLGEVCLLRDPGSDETALAELIGLQSNSVWMAPLGEIGGLSSRTLVTFTGKPLHVRVGHALLGRVLDGLGRFLDDDDAEWLEVNASQPVFSRPKHPLKRDLIDQPLPLGIRAIDGFLTCGKGQRLGIYGAAGIGKSTLIGEIVNNASSDINVVALIGERGREVGEFLSRTITDAGKQRSIFVVATSDRPAVERIKAAHVATTIAEWFRDQGRDVLLVLDSVTRIARAYREVGLAAGEPATRRGFPPSVFAALPELFERAGPSDHGTITAFYSVLVEGELRQDPIADETVSLLDGHIVLSPELAQAGHYPAIDILQSLSRLMTKLVSAEQTAAVSRIRSLMARYREIELLVRIGEYQRGSDRLADEAIDKRDAINRFLCQPMNESTDFSDVVRQLSKLAASGRHRR